VSPRTVVNERIEQRRAAVAAARRRRVLGRVLLVVVLVGTVTAAVALERSSLVAVASIEVVGADRLAAEDVLAATGVEVGTSVLRVRTGEVQRRVEALPMVERATVERDGPLGIVVTVEEVAPALSARFEDGDVLVDEAGLVIGEGVAPGTPVVRVVGTAPTPGERIDGYPPLATAHAVLLGLPGPVAALVTGASVDETASVELTLADGTRVRWGDEVRGDEKARALGAVLEDLDGRAVAVIDVRAPAAPTVVP
jgi:cell division septal protein FtsQ